MSTPPADTLRADAERFPWYHTIDLGSGVVTRGMFDHRPHLPLYGLPADLRGKRCLDVGTMDGFWAFELARRGADEVVAIDVEDPTALDWPASLRDQEKSLDETKAERFALAQRALGLEVRRVDLSVYDLTPDLGRFDVVFCGDLLLHLKDPVTAVENIRAVCTGQAWIVNPIIRFGRRRDREPLARFEGVDGFTWWMTNLRGLARIVESAGFRHIRARKPFEVPFSVGGWEGLRGVVIGSV